MSQTQVIPASSHSPGLAEVLERVLDKGVVIAGDIKIKLCDIELLTIQIRLLIASVDKARELGLEWWWQPSRAHEGVPPPVAFPPLPVPAGRPAAIPAEPCQGDAWGPICVFPAWNAAGDGMEAPQSLHSS
jgi:hypothetical protein